MNGNTTARRALPGAYGPLYRARNRQVQVRRAGRACSFANLAKLARNASEELTGSGARERVERPDAYPCADLHRRSA